MNLSNLYITTQLASVQPVLDLMDDLAGLLPHSMMNRTTEAQASMGKARLISHRLSRTSIQSFEDQPEDNLGGQHVFMVNAALDCDGCLELMRESEVRLDDWSQKYVECSLLPSYMAELEENGRFQ